MRDEENKRSPAAGDVFDDLIQILHTFGALDTRSSTLQCAFTQHFRLLVLMYIISREEENGMKERLCKTWKLSL